MANGKDGIIVHPSLPPAHLILTHLQEKEYTLWSSLALVPSFLPNPSLHSTWGYMWNKAENTVGVRL